MNKYHSLIPKLSEIIIPPSPPDIKPVYTTGIIPLGHLGPTYIVSPLTSHTSSESSSTIEDDISTNNNTNTSLNPISPANKKRKVNE